MTYFYKTYSFNIFQNKTFQEIAESEGIRNVWIRSGVVLGRKGNYFFGGYSIIQCKSGRLYCTYFGLSGTVKRFFRITPR